MEKIPEDPVMLLSYINTQLRDFYSSREELCAALSIVPEELDRKLERIDYRYDRSENRYL